MLQKTLSLMLIGLVLNLALYPTNARANTIQDDKEAKLAEKIKNKVVKLGLGEKVKVKLKDGTNIKGYISEIKTDQFTITNNGQPTTIQFIQAKQVKIDESIIFWGRNSPKRALIATIGFIILYGILVVRSDF